MASFCEHCGAPLTTGTRFCEACGKPISTIIDKAKGGQPQSYTLSPVRPAPSRRMNNIFVALGLIMGLIVFIVVGLVWWHGQLPAKKSVTSQKEVPPQTSAPSPAEQLLVGKWQLIQRNDPSDLSNYKGITEFLDDGTIIWLEHGETIDPQRWNVLKDGRIKVQLKGQIIFPVFQGDKLVLEYNSLVNGKPIKEIYVRAGSSTPAKQMSEAPRQPAEQPPAPKPQAEPLPQPQVEPKTATGSFSLDEEAPSSAPAKPSLTPPAPGAVPPPQAARGGRWSWTSGRLIQPDDFGLLSLLDLELMRNEIYARHGWTFHRQDLRDYFERQPWYRPKGDLSNWEQANRRVLAELTSIEKKNVQTIISREKALKR